MTLYINLDVLQLFIGTVLLGLMAALSIQVNESMKNLVIENKAPETKM
jgi:hypothetical protein